jgi:hypothetical protein
VLYGVVKNRPLNVQYDNMTYFRWIGLGGEKGEESPKKRKKEKKKEKKANVRSVSMSSDTRES